MASAPPRPAKLALQQPLVFLCPEGGITPKSRGTSAPVNWEGALCCVLCWERDVLYLELGVSLCATAQSRINS